MTPVVTASPSTSTAAPIAATDEHSVEETLEWHKTHKHAFEEAQRLKTEGNKRFVASSLDEAINLYKEALAYLPPRPPPAANQKGKARARADDEGETADAANPSTADDERDAEEEDDLSLPLSSEVRDLRATLHANVAACHVKADRWKDAVDWCTEALGDDPAYVKALQRRSMANEKIDSWSSLSSALDDQKTLFSLPNLSAAQTAQAKAALARLPPLVERRKEAETAEMLGKLKELGNSFLGKFGISTDNFKLTPNGEGGHSINFVR